MRLLSRGHAGRDADAGEVIEVDTPGSCPLDPLSLRSGRNLAVRKPRPVQRRGSARGVGRAQEDSDL
jgi:hypothetical protein